MSSETLNPIHSCRLGVAVQILEFAAEGGQFSDATLLLRNAGVIRLNVSLVSNNHAALFTITPEECQLEPSDNTEIHVRFHAPGSPELNIYERS